MQTYFSILLPLIAADMLWLGVITKSFYQKHLGYIFAEKFTLWPAGLFYIMYAFGIMYFVVNPALEAKSLSTAVMRGAFLGLIAYGTYDLTNQATLAKWPLNVTLIDMAWGIFVTALVSAIAYTLLK
ncbi:MAG: DUF2177 family protein [Candidatus Pacebacteria bacterium]|nr:DUF2177 family protein [Candidatus Paceibacterota bacterium]